LESDVCQESVVVPDPNTIIDPWAVMIESFHTLMADCAMSTSDGSQNFAFGAKLSGVEIFHKLDKFNSFFNVTWIFAVSQSQKEQSQEYQAGIYYDVNIVQIYKILDTISLH
jgi:hypothetical protein